MDTKPFKLELTQKILDNVHGYIYYTQEEGRIINLPLFRRLQGIKQLSLIDHVFPGAEHTRFIHSIGVMYIADKMAIRLGFSDEQRRVVRLAGLLHDIGHYPLSHVCEHAYKDYHISVGDFSLHDDREIRKSINRTTDIKTDFMEGSKKAHHERVSAIIVQKSKQINEIINDDKIIKQICAMIVGDGRTEGIDKVMVQILHAEIDADGIDYILRDALFSGTSFGHFEVDMLISNLGIKEVQGEKIIYVNPKGIPAADQYLINKFFSYSQVTHNERVDIYEWMASVIVAYLQTTSVYFPNADTLLNEWINDAEGTEKFLHFDDSFFWKTLRDVAENPLAGLPQTQTVKDITQFCKHLISHQDLDMVEDTELRFDSEKPEEAKERIEKWLSENFDGNDRIVTLFSSVGFTKHVPLDVFMCKLKMDAEKITKSNEEDPEPGGEEEIKQDQEKKMLWRLMDGMATVNQEGQVVLLCDDERSLMHFLYKVKLYIMRQYKLDS